MLYSTTTNINIHFDRFHLSLNGKVMYRKSGKAVTPDGQPVSYGEEKNRKCYILKTDNFCIDGAVEYGNPNGFVNDEGDTFLATCAEALRETPVSVNLDSSPEDTDRVMDYLPKIKNDKTR
jgi:hypothetical protein